MHDHSQHNHESTKNIGVAFILNLGFAVAEIFIALWTNSLAVLSNSLHDFGDSFSLGLSWYFDKISKKQRSDNFTYGYKRFSIVPVVVNSIILLLGSAYILYQAANRILSPEKTNTGGMIWFALAGMLINLIAYLRLRRGKSLNEKSSSLHLLDDVLGLFAVLVVSITMRFANAPILDPILSAIITIFVITKIYQNIISANRIFLQAVPSSVDMTRLKSKLEQLDGVESIHDLHAWSLDGESNVLTVHLVIKDNKDHIQLKCTARQLIEQCGINHSTIETELMGENCELEHC